MVVEQHNRLFMGEDGDSQCESTDFVGSNGTCKEPSPNSLSKDQSTDGETVGNLDTKRSSRDTAKDLGYTLARTVKIKQISTKIWLVPSQSGNGVYEVTLDNGKSSCTCPHFKFRGFRAGFCKHQWAVKYHLVLHKDENVNVKLELNHSNEEKTIACKSCQSTNCIRYGTHGKRKKQVWQCKDCNKTFIPDGPFQRMKYDPKVISLSLSMYFRLMSLRSIKDTLEETFGLKISHQTVHNWIAKYSELLTKYMESMVPHFGGQINADELYVFIKDELRYWFIAIDPDTRYMLASAIAERKDTHGAVELFEKAKLSIRDQMLIRVVTDGLTAYGKGYKRVFYSKDHPYREHETAIRLNGDINNNIMERVNNTVRDREKCFRRLKSENSPIFKMYPIFYNHVRKHQGLNGLRPGEASGMCLDLGKDRWLGLINNAYKAKDEQKIEVSNANERDLGKLDCYFDPLSINARLAKPNCENEVPPEDPLMSVAKCTDKGNKQSKLLKNWKQKGWL